MALSQQLLRVDPIVCDGNGLCAELLPERITLDDWGYPIVDPAPVGADLLAHARRAVSACPLLALRLEAPRPAAARTAGYAGTGGLRPTAQNSVVGDRQVAAGGDQVHQPLDDPPRLVVVVDVVLLDVVLLDQPWSSMTGSAPCSLVPRLWHDGACEVVGLGCRPAG